MKSHSSSIFTVKKLDVRHSNSKSVFVVPHLLFTLEDCSGPQSYLGMLRANTAFWILPVL